jgi:hypothetical protein
MIRRALGLVLACAALPLAACSEVDSTSSAGYEPSKLHHAKGEDAPRVTFTAEAVRRADLRTVAVRERGRRMVVPYPALLYDRDGQTMVYTVAEPRTYLRADVEVDRIVGDRVLLSHGPAAGTEVVTQGAVQVYGAELEIGGGH